MAAAKRRGGSNRRESAAPQKAAISGRSALAGLETALSLVDHIDSALAGGDAVVAVAAAARFQRIAEFHGSTSGRAHRAGNVSTKSGADHKGAGRPRQRPAIGRRN